jgi:hypothetical protein
VSAPAIRPNARFRAQNGATVVLLETAPEEARAAIPPSRARHPLHLAGVEDLEQVSPEIGDLDLASIDLGSYTDSNISTNGASPSIAATPTSPIS